MPHNPSVVEELERAFISGTPGKRDDMLVRVTDLFLTAPATLTSEQASLFDDIINNLVTHLERRSLVMRPPCLLILPSLSLPPLECCFGTSPIQAEKLRPARKAFGSATQATRAVASIGPTPGIASSRKLVSLDRCQAMICRSNSRICSLSLRS